MTHPSGDLGEEIARLDREIDILLYRAEQARQAWAEADGILGAARQRREQLVWRQAAQRSAAPPATATLAPTAPPAPSAPAAEPPVGGAPPETSTRTVQNVLFVLGGLLLSIAAIVFTAVAWATYGLVARAVILAIVTAIALAAPLIALWRHLRATAETFAAVGMLLVLLDGYAAWAVNLFGLNDIPGTRYAGLVFLVTAVLAAAYRRLTRLAGPGFVALGASQAVLPLLAADPPPGPAMSSVLASAVALLNVIVLWRHEGDSPYGVGLRTVARILHASALVVALLFAVVALIEPSTVGQAAQALGAIVLIPIVYLAGALSGRLEARLALAACLVVLGVVVGAGRFVSVAWPDQTIVLVSAVVAATALLAALARVRAVADQPDSWLGAEEPAVQGTVDKSPATVDDTPSTVDGPGARTGLRGAVIPRTRPGLALRSGVRAGALVATGVLGLVLGTLALVAALDSVAAVVPSWHADLERPPRFDWQLLAGLGLLAIALAAVLARAAILDTLLAVGALAVLALPDTVHLVWWAPSLVDLIAAAGVTGAAIVATCPRSAGVRGLLAAALTVHAVLTGLARPVSTAWVAGALVVLGLAVAALSRPRVEHRRVIGGLGVLVGLVALPAAAGAALIAAGTLPWWTARLTIAAVALVVAALVGVGRFWPELTWYAFGAAVGSAALWPAVVALDGHDPVGIYAGIALVLLAACLLPVPPEVFARTAVAAAAIPAGFLLLTDVLPAVLSVVALPYTWLREIWTGVPAGVGLAPPESLVDKPFVTVAAAVALALLALASATAAFAIWRRFSAAVAGLAIGGPTAILVALAAAGAPWPSVPAVTLLIGLTITVAAAVRSGSSWRTTIAVAQGLAYIGAGLAGALTVEWATISALSSIVVGAAVVAAVGRTPVWRVAGAVVAVVAGAATAAASGLAADMALRSVAFLVLATALIALEAGALLRPRRRLEATALEAAAHATAVVALLFTLGSAGHAAVVSALWGIAVGLRALLPDIGRAARAGFAALAAAWELVAWWLLLANRDVTLVEAYTLPLALVALLAGWAALRSRPELRSWVAYGPALAAAFLPSLAAVLVIENPPGAPWRRLLLGAGALAVVYAGAIRRRQAPVVVGGSVLVLVALHEIVLVWDLFPRWSLIAVAGAIVLGLAVTYERRRRDLARLRGAIGRMR